LYVSFVVLWFFWGLLRHVPSLLFPPPPFLAPRLCRPSVSTLSCTIPDSIR
jgi:hypothetical protein